MASSTVRAATTDILIANHDVLVLIFKHFIPSVFDGVSEDPLAKGGRKDLLNLTLTCKAFVEPALECLWSHLESLEPLFKLHPWLKIVDDSYLFCGSDGDLKLSRYHKYAGKVRTVTFRREDATSNSYRRIVFAGGAWLGHQLQGSPLLPGLRSMFFAQCYEDSPHLGLLPLMLSSTVERIKFGNQFLSAPTFLSFAFPLTCDGLPSLTELVLDDPGSSGQACQGIWDVLDAISPRLRSLTLRFPVSDTLQSGTLRRLAQRLRTITSLTLDVHTPCHESSEDTSAECFPSLHNLHLVNRSGVALCPCYPSFLVRKATAVTFSLTGDVTESNAFAESLDTLSTLEGLKMVKIEGSSQSVPVEAIRSFLQRLQLEELQLQRLWGFHQIGGQHGERPLRSLFGDSSHIRRLERYGLPIWRKTDSYHHYDRRTRRWAQSKHPQNYPPLSYLLHVARHHEKLRRVSLSVDSSGHGVTGQTVSSIIRDWVNPTRPSQLRYLEIADMRPSEKNFTPGECRNIAHFLDLLFPSLVSVTTIEHPSLSSTWEAHWRLIEEHRQMAKSLRLYRESRW